MREEGKARTKSNGVMNRVKERDGSHIAQAELTESVNSLEVKENERRHQILGNWEDHDTIKMSNAIFLHLLIVLF